MHQGHIHNKNSSHSHKVKNLGLERSEGPFCNSLQGSDNYQENSAMKNSRIPLVWQVKMSNVTLPVSMSISSMLAGFVTTPDVFWRLCVRPCRRSEPTCLSVCLSVCVSIRYTKHAHCSHTTNIKEKYQYIQVTIEILRCMVVRCILNQFMIKWYCFLFPWCSNFLSPLKTFLVVF